MHKDNRERCGTLLEYILSGRLDSGVTTSTLCASVNFVVVVAQAKDIRDAVDPETLFLLAQCAYKKAHPIRLGTAQLAKILAADSRMWPLSLDSVYDFLCLQVR